MSYDIFLFAGEPSGDLHGEALLRNLYACKKNLKVCGVAGPRMRSIGIDTILPMEEFQVMGFVDVFLALPKLIRHFYHIADFLLKTQPKVALFIDYPGFNLRMERYLKKKGFTGKIVHYICPSVWAWGKQRIPSMEQTLDLLLTIFPFEKQYFSPKLPVSYVGHPLVERIHSYSYSPLPFPPSKQIVALFPGSRKKELSLNFPVYLQAVKKILSSRTDIVFAISLSQQAFLPLLEKHLHNEGLSIKENILLIPPERTYDLMKQAHFAIAKSGTVTLELALHHVPTIVTYGIAPLDLFIAQHLLRISLPFYCIVNIAAGKEVFKELIGPHLTLSNLLLEWSRLSENQANQERCKQECLHLEQSFGREKAAEKAAALIFSQWFME